MPRKLGGWPMSRMNPHDIARGDIKAVLNAKAEHAPYMANRLFETIRRIYSWGVEEDKVQASPCVGIKKPGGKEPPRERVLNAEEIRNVWEALGAERPLIGSFFKLLFYTGARRGEVLGIRWRDVDFEQTLWTLPDTKMNRGHTLPLSNEAVDVLRSLYPLTGNSEWIFMGPTGAAIQNPQKAVARVRINSKVQFRIHDVRRTVATGLAQIGVRPLTCCGSISCGCSASRGQSVARARRDRRLRRAARPAPAQPVPPARRNRARAVRGQRGSTSRDRS